MTPKTTHVAQGLDRRLEQYRNDPDLQAMMTSLLARAQELEDCLWEIINNRDVDSSVGIQLDILGKLVGRGRGLLLDDAYRIAIRCQIAINRSSGTPKDLGTVTILSLTAGFVWSYGEGYPAGVVIILQDTWTDTDQALQVVFTNLQKTRSGGVRLFLEYHEVVTSETFTWSPYLITLPDIELGWGDVIHAVGGFWASVISE